MLRYGRRNISLVISLVKRTLKRDHKMNLKTQSNVIIEAKGRDNFAASVEIYFPHFIQHWPVPHLKSFVKFWLPHFKKD